MKKLICLMTVLVMLLSACGCDNNANDNTTTDGGVVEDTDGVIDEDTNTNNGSNMVDDVTEGAGDVVDGATDVVDDAVGGVENAVDDMTDSNSNKK